jgi:hypothetical protein
MVKITKNQKKVNSQNKAGFDACEGLSKAFHHPFWKSVLKEIPSEMLEKCNNIVVNTFFLYYFSFLPPLFSLRYFYGIQGK